MARKVGPFDTSVFYEVENRRLQKALAAGFSSGFASLPNGGQGAVTAGTGAQLVIAAYPDGALVDGMYVENPTSETVTITTNTASTNPRMDRLVLRLDMSAKTIAPFQIVGTPAVSPSPPTLTRTSTVFDIPLCRYTFPGSGSAQNPGSIVDERNWIGIGPSISGGLQRTGTTNTFKLNPDAFTDLQTIVSSQQGSWREYNPGNGIGRTCDAPGLYRVDAALRSGFSNPQGQPVADRYEELVCEVAGIGQIILGPGGSPKNGFGGAAGSVDIECPNGISIIFRHFCGPGPTAEGDIVTSRWGVRWVRQLS